MAFALCLFLVDFSVSGAEEIGAFGVAGNVDGTFWRVSDLRQYLIKAAGMIGGFESVEDGSLKVIELNHVLLLEVGCGHDIRHRSVITERRITEDNGFEVDTEDFAIREQGSGKVGDLGLLSVFVVLC